MPRSSGGVVGAGVGASGTRSIFTPSIPSQSSTVLRAGGTAATRTSTASGIATRGQRRRGALEPRAHARRHVGLRRPLDARARAGGRRRSQLLLQPRQRPRQPRLHGPRAAAEHRRGLALRQPEEVAARDGLPLLLPQRVDRGEQLARAARGRGAPPPETGPRRRRGAPRPGAARSRARRADARRRLRASLATIASSHGRNGAPARKRPRARYALTKASCTTSSASAAEPVMTYAVRKAIPWCSRTSWS